VNESSRRLQSLLLGFVPTSTRQALEVALIVTRADLAPPYIMPPLISTPTQDDPLVHEINTNPKFGQLWEVYSQDGNGAYRATLHALLVSLTSLTAEDYNRRMLAISISITGLTQDTRSFSPILEIANQHEMLERHLLRTNDNPLLATLRHATAGFAVRQFGLPLCNSSQGWDSLITTQVWKDPTYIDADPSKACASTQPLNSPPTPSSTPKLNHLLLSSTPLPTASTATS
jgi:hypothetical protein